jgi:hypothetical protein
MSALLILLAGVSFAGKKAETPEPPPTGAWEGRRGCEVPKGDPGDKKGCLFDTWGELRLINSLPPTDLVLDADGTTLGQGFVADSRLRVGAQLGPRLFHGAVEGDLIEGQAAGDPWDLLGAEDDRERQTVGVFRQGAFDLRRASVGGLAGPIDIEAGLQTSHWGLGMLANDGAHDPTFGRNDFGDRVLRVRFATKPIDSGRNPLTFILAGDRVVEDELAEWHLFEDEAGAAAYQGIASVSWLPEDPKDLTRGGLYGVYRHQTEPDGERVTEVWVIDGYGDETWDLGTWTLRAAGEAATLLGSTDRAQTYNSRDGVKVRQLGVTGLLEAKNHPETLRGLLRSGYASGDGDPDDDTLHDFVFDRDFDAGMTLFDEVRGAIDAQTYNQLSDPENSGGAPEGADALVGEGAFSHAVFVQPVIGGKPLAWLDLQGGVTMSWNTRPITHPFESYRNGGVPANHLGQPTEGYKLGTELDWAVKIGDVDVLADNKTRWRLSPTLLLQGGHLFLSEAMGGETVSLVTATGRIRW